PRGDRGPDPVPRAAGPGRAPARGWSAVRHGIRRCADDRAPEGGAARADHGGGAEGEPPARHHDDGGGPELRRPVGGAEFSRLEYARYESRPPPCREPS